MGEAADVFTVVALAVLSTAITNYMRRRNREKFDRDIAEAAMQTTATWHSADFYDYGYGSKSAESHGT